MDILKKWGIYYISNRIVQTHDAVMFDIDDTLIFTNRAPVVPMIELLHIAHGMGYKIILITARPGTDMNIRWTVQQLRDYGIIYDTLIFTSAETKYIVKRKLPYNFILSVGDMPTDLTGSKHFLNTSNFYHN
jgi:ribonucleotide monophosphatase NagD (HAD superfamily)